MLTRLYVHNYKCLVNFELRLGDINLLLGPNGSGKSAVLDVAYAVRQLLLGDSKVNGIDCFPSTALTAWQLDRTQVIEIDAEVDGGSYRYRLEIEHDRFQKRTARIRLERLMAGDTTLFAFVDGEVQLYRDDGSSGPSYTADWTDVWLLDEPENFVALAETQPWLQELSQLCEDTDSQAILCSHHLELVDYLGPSRGCWLRRAIFVLPRRSSRRCHVVPLVKPVTSGHSRPPVVRKPCEFTMPIRSRGLAVHTVEAQVKCCLANCLARPVWHGVAVGINGIGRRQAERRDAGLCVGIERGAVGQFDFDDDRGCGGVEEPRVRATAELPLQIGMNGLSVIVEIQASDASRVPSPACVG